MTIFGSSSMPITTMTLTSSRAKSALLTMLSLNIACLFAVELARGSGSVGALTLHGALFALFAVFSITLLLHTVRPTRLQLGSDGFSYQTLFGQRAWRWEDVSEFHLVSIKDAKRPDAVRQLPFVGFDMVLAHQTQSAKRSRKAVGFDISFKNNFLPADGDLVDILNTWRSRAVGLGLNKDILSPGVN